jgi:hypothetical protein
MGELGDPGTGERKTAQKFTKFCLRNLREIVYSFVFFTYYSFYLRGCWVLSRSISWNPKGFSGLGKCPAGPGRLPAGGRPLVQVRASAPWSPEPDGPGENL